MAESYYGAMFDPGEAVAAGAGGGGASKWSQVFKRASAARRTAGLPRALWESLRGKVRERPPVAGELTGGSAGQMQTFKTPEGKNKYLISTHESVRPEEYRHAAIREVEAQTGRPALTTEQAMRLAEGQRQGLIRAQDRYSGREPSIQMEEFLVQNPQAMREISKRYRSRMGQAAQTEASVQKALREFEAARMRKLVE